VGQRRSDGVRRQVRQRIVLVGIVVVAMTVASCGRSSSSLPANVLTDDAITVGSFDFAESQLLAELYGQALERHGYRVERAGRLGPREFVGPALLRGLVELVPEYASTAADFYSLGRQGTGSDVAATHQGLVAALAGRSITVLASAPAQNANTFVVERATAQRFGLRSLTDLAAAAPSLVFGGPPECPNRPRCLAGLRARYGVRFKQVVALDTGGPLSVQALRSGAVDVALLFTTDAVLLREPFVALNDDRRLQGAENITPLMRSETLDRWGPALARVIDAVSAHLTTAALRQLNAEAAGVPVGEVAHRWLAVEGL
jgi:osmoprotectant transport system substrate-binding protein